MLETVINKNIYESDGAATEYAFTFTIWEEDQIVVYTGDGDCANETEITDFTVTITDTGGTVVLAEPPDVGLKIIIMRKMPFLQEDQYVTGARFDPAEIEDRFDQDCAERQDLVEAVNRCVKVCLTSDETPEELLQSIFDARDEACACRDESCECRDESCECADRAEAALQEAEELAAMLNYVGGGEVIYECASNYDAGQTLTIPYSGFYIYGTYHLRISIDGIVLSHEHYEEVGENRGDISHSVKFLMPLYEGQKICYWTIPLGEAGEILTELRTEAAAAIETIESLLAETQTARDEACECAENAAASATAAATSEANAATSESNAATSESNAATSEANAATSESNAAASAEAAATSETNAATSAATAAECQEAACACRDEACECADRAEAALEVVEGTISLMEYSGGMEGTETLTTAYEAGATLTLPGDLYYYVGAYQLRVSIDGIVLSHTHYTEVGDEGETSTSVTFNMPLYSGQEICYWVTPMGTTEETLNNVLDSVEAADFVALFEAEL